ncbi:hypothetical protein [Mitsuokella multacida]
MKIIKAIREHERITIKRIDNDYVFEWDEDEVSKQELRKLHIQAVLLPEDYEKYFASSVDDTLKDIEEASKKMIAMPSDEQDELVIEGDIAYSIPLNQSELLLELTDTVRGRERLRCIVSRLDAQLQHIHPNRRVRLRGFLTFCPAFAQVQMEATRIELLPDETKLLLKEQEEKDKLANVVKREKVRIKDAIRDWHTVLVFCPDDAAWNNFISITSQDESKQKDTDKDTHGEALQYHRISGRKTSEELTAQIRACNQEDKYNAICFLQGPVRDRYAYAPFYSAELCQAINESHIPVLAGIGNAKGYKPFFVQYVDYSAKTAQTLAYNLTYWKLKSGFSKNSRSEQMTITESNQTDSKKPSLLDRVLHRLFSS